MSQKGRVSRIISRIAEYGLLGFLQDSQKTIVDRWFESKLGIETTSKGEFGPETYSKEDSINYVPIGYGPLSKLLNRVMRRKRRVFLDFGSGMGRAVFLAATYPFEKVIGVELSTELTSIATENAARAKIKRCENVELVCVDATEYDVPDDVDVVHFFKPFVGETLKKVTARLRESHNRSPRHMSVIFFNHDEFEALVNAEDWLRQVDSGTFFSRTKNPLSWGLYEAEGEES